ncbi:MAG: amino acid racemase [Acetatifactor sp.]|nr:amino acid racemase [Acetatifactor sp.]
MKKLGIIGGLGPMATVYFLQLITQMSEARVDQEHMEILLHSKPSIPDRTRFILGLSDENPLKEMIEIGLELKGQGAEAIAIPCITAHYFHNELEEALQMPVLHAIRDTGRYLKDRGVKTVGIMATDGTVTSGLFQKELLQFGIQPIAPEKEKQSYVMQIIYDQVKTGKPGSLSMLEEVAASLRTRGAEVCLLGCTELSLLKRDNILPAGYLDVMEILAMRAVRECGMFRKEYEELITV